jgi:hypothetical protein
LHAAAVDSGFDEEREGYDEEREGNHEGRVLV